MRYVRLLVHALGDSAALNEILLAHGISAEQLHDPVGRMPYSEAAKLLCDVRDTLQIPHLGLLLGASLHLSALGPLGIASLTQASLGAAQDEFLRYSRTLFPFCDWCVKVSGGNLCIQLTVVGASSGAAQILTEALMLASLNTLEFLTNQRFTNSLVRFRFPAPPYSSRFHHAFSCPVQFGADNNELILPAAVRQLSNAFHAPAIHALALGQLRMQQGTESGQDELADYVLRRAAEDPLSPPSLVTLAAELHVSPRTLIRHLGARGLRYQDLKGEVKRQFVASMLRLGNTKIDVLASELGFHDASSFRRSFRRWFGCSPSEFRRRERRNSSEVAR
jgi:AraC-like DNA-binding protein